MGKTVTRTCPGQQSFLNDPAGFAAPEAATQPRTTPAATEISAPRFSMKNRRPEPAAGPAADADRKKSRTFPLSREEIVQESKFSKVLQVIQGVRASLTVQTAALAKAQEECGSLEESENSYAYSAAMLKVNAADGVVQGTANRILEAAERLGMSFNRKKVESIIKYEDAAKWANATLDALSGEIENVIVELENAQMELQKARFHASVEPGSVNLMPLEGKVGDLGARLMDVARALANI